MITALIIAVLVISGFLVGQSALLQGKLTPIKFNESSIIKKKPLSATRRFTKNVTRGQLVNRLLRDAGYTLQPCSGSLFPDVPSTHPYCDAIEEAVAQGIVNGYTDGTFHPNQFVNRAESAKVAYLTYNIPLYTPLTPSYNDVEATVWFYVFVESLNAEGAFSITSGNWNPEKLLTLNALGYWTSQL